MKKNVKLIIDTGKRNAVLVGIKTNGKEVFLHKENSSTKAQKLLHLIEIILSRCKLSVSDLTEIEINQGPGSFVGLRVGIAVANTLGFVLNIPVNGKKIPVEPRYEKE